MNEDEKILVSVDVLDEILGMANSGVWLCKSILEGKANPQYIVEQEFMKFFKYMQDELLPLVYPKDELKS